MKTIYIIELTIAALLFIIMIIALFNKRTKKLRIVISVVLIDLCIFGYVGFSYFSEEPKLSLKGEEKIMLGVNENYQEHGVEAKYHEKDVTNEVKITGEVDTTKPGIYTIRYQYTYLKNKTKELERIIYIEDKEAPKIKLKGKNEITIYTNEKYKEPGYTVEDNVDKDLTKKVKVEKKTISNTEYQLIYTIEDSSGNKATATRTVHLKEPPKTNETNPIKGSNNGVIYLTFDDGPSLDITPKILDILKEENIKATFFILNYDSNREVLVKRIIKEGHSIGIHGYSHDYKKIYQSVDSYMENLTKLQDKIKKSTGVTTYLTRFPGGSSNTISNFNPKIMTKLTKEIVAKGFRYYDWNVSAEDAGSARNRDQVYNNVTKGLYRNGNNVVLMHDFSGNNKTLEALRAIIQYGKKNGYTFEAITNNTPMVTHKVNN